MAFDESTISGPARMKYLRLGRQFSSTLVLALANQYVEALVKHGAALVAHGYGADDALLMTDARDALQGASAGRTGAKGNKTTLSAGQRDALKAGRAARRSGRSVLVAGARTLRQAGGDAAEEAARGIDGILAATGKSPRYDGEALAAQLDAIRVKLVEPAVAAAVASRGGPAAVARLQAAATTLRVSIQKNAGAGTNEATELMDLLDGLIVTLARNARKAALEAAAELGKPAIAEAFHMRELYAGKGEPREEAPAPPAPPSPSPEPSPSPPPVTEAAAAVEESGPISRAA